MFKKKMSFVSEGLILEASLDLPDDSGGPWPGVVLCHPKPEMGGDMYNGVIQATSWALGALGIASLRYNTRGVGRSQGRIRVGVPELADCEAAIAFMSEQSEIQIEHMGIMGYSYGNASSMPIGGDHPLIKAIAAISPLIPSGALTDCPKPKLIICGDRDDIVYTDLVIIESKKMSDPKRIEILPGVDHFWWGSETEGAELVAQFMAEHLRGEK